MTHKEMLKQEAKAYILEIIERHTFGQALKEKEPELLIFIKSVSRSGMSRNMIVMLDNINITYYVNQLLEYSTKSNYIRVGGCGMDMTFWLADRITKELYTIETKDQDGKLSYKNNAPYWLTGNGGGCLKWRSIY